jgi:hypothetical protein
MPDDRRDRHRDASRGAGVRNRGTAVTADIVVTEHSRASGDEEARFYEVKSYRGGVHIVGLSPREASDALKLLFAARHLQYEHGVAASKGLLRTVAAAGLDLTPPATVEQARRSADLRRDLLATPTFTYDTLAQQRGDARSSSTRTWVSRARSRKELFTVDVDGRTIIPAFQLTDAGKTRPALAPALSQLLDADVGGWSVWTWLTRPTPLLSGGTPTDLADEAPERVRRAARRFASSTRTAA